MAHWVWLKHHRFPENIKVFSTAQTARYRPFCDMKKENGEGFKKERGRGVKKTDTLTEEETNWFSQYLLIDI